MSESETSAVAHCIGCGSPRVVLLKDFGPQPPSNRFLRAAAEPEDHHRLGFGQCEGCGLFQLIEPMSADMVRARFDWLTYNEPEGHLDELVERVSRLPGVNQASRIVGLTYKDDSTLARFNRRGCYNTFRYDPDADLSLPDRRAGLESVQAALTDSLAARLVARHGKADVLFARHVLEHAHHPARFLGALAQLMNPGGLIVLEMPDCTKFVKACDYSFVWEEHIAYFSSATLGTLVSGAALAICETVLYPYPLEDSLVCIIRNGRQDGVPGSGRKEVEAALADGRAFARRFSELSDRLHLVFGGWQRKGKKVAVFGAGHLAAKFVNMFNLSGFLECVIDDNPHKQNLLMPGSRLPILGSAALRARAIDLCLLSLNPESELKVLANNQPFLDCGGQFLSIFALSPRTIYKVSAP